MVRGIAVGRFILRLRVRVVCSDGSYAIWCSGGSGGVMRGYGVLGMVCEGD